MKHAQKLIIVKIVKVRNITTIITVLSASASQWIGMGSCVEVSWPCTVVSVFLHCLHSWCNIINLVSSRSSLWMAESVSWLMLMCVCVFALLDVSILHTSTVCTSFNRSIFEQLFITRYWLDTWIMRSHWGKVACFSWTLFAFLLYIYVMHVHVPFVVVSSIRKLFDVFSFCCNSHWFGVAFRAFCILDLASSNHY